MAPSEIHVDLMGYRVEVHVTAYTQLNIPDVRNDYIIISNVSTQLLPFVKFPQVKLLGEPNLLQDNTGLITTSFAS